MMVNPIIQGVLGSLAAGLATSIGALPALFFKGINKKFYHLTLGLAAGIMLAATFFSLLVPALEKGSALLVGAGIFAGALLIHLVDRHVPHDHFIKGHHGPKSTRLKGITLVLMAITIHNFPEGMAVGVGFAGGGMAGGLTLALGIGIQNIPEGMAVALPLKSEGYSSWQAFKWATLTGLVEPVGGLVGATLVTLARPFLPFIMALAAGAMLFVISEEMIPETHSQGLERLATFSLIGGFVLMMLLDVLLG